MFCSGGKLCLLHYYFVDRVCFDTLRSWFCCIHLPLHSSLCDKMNYGVLQIIVNEFLSHCLVLERSKQCSLTSCPVQEFSKEKGGSSLNLSTLRLSSLLLREAVYFILGDILNVCLYFKPKLTFL